MGQLDHFIVLLSYSFYCFDLLFLYCIILLFLFDFMSNTLVSSALISATQIIN